MRIAILCPGPSLANLSGPPHADLTIAVNRAATAFPADVWACGDPDLLLWERPNVLGLPELFTTQLAAAKLAEQSAGDPWPRPVTTFESLACPLPQWQTFTATAALVFAAARIDAGTRRRGDAEKHEIAVYGCDWSGVDDFDGELIVPAGNRTPDRWQLERNIWQNLLVPWLAAQQIAVRRLT